MIISLKLTNNLIYNGETQTLVSGGSNTSYDNNYQKDAGTYEVIAKANTGYTFSNGESVKILNCEIEKKPITISYNTTSLKYNGKYQAPTPTAIGVKGETIELTTTKETEVGNYTTIVKMQDVNPNYTLRNTVIDYKITNNDESNKITNITKLKINYYLMNSDLESYSLVKSKEVEVKEGETITGEVIKYNGYKEIKPITIKIVKGLNTIDYYYEKNV